MKIIEILKVKSMQEMCSYLAWSRRSSEEIFALLKSELWHWPQKDLKFSLVFRSHLSFTFEKLLTYNFLSEKLLIYFENYKSYKTSSSSSTVQVTKILVCTFQQIKIRKWYMKAAHCKIVFNNVIICFPFSRKEKIFYSYLYSP